MLNYQKIVQDLEKLIAGKISVSNFDLTRVSKDASLFTVRPQMVIYPKDKFDIQAIVKYVASLKKAYSDFDNKFDKELVDDLSITVRSAGTDMTGGPLNNSIILDVTKFMNKHGKIEHIGPEKFITCDPGLYFRDLEKYLDTKDLLYPSYPASKDLCCVGGIVSNNSSGEKSLHYGSTKDWVSEVECVLSDGSIYTFREISFKEFDNLLSEEGGPGRSAAAPDLVKEIFTKISELIDFNRDEILKNKPIVSKNSSGYNLWDTIDYKNKTINLAKLIIGSQGTLGIVVSAKLKLTTKKKYSQMLTVFMPDLKDLVPMVNEILKYSPVAVETFDDHTFKIAMKFLPSIIWKIKGSIFQLAISFIPEAWLVLTGGIPKLILMAEFEGMTQEEANAKAKLALLDIKKYNYKCRIARNKIDVQKYWLFRRESFNLLRSKLKGFRTAPFVDDIIIPIEKMPEFIPQMQEILDKNKFVYTIAGHAGNGNFHIIPLMKLKDEEEIDLIKNTNIQVFSLVQKYHGSLSAEHNDGLVRTPYLHYMFSAECLDFFNRVKFIFDPQNIFNPGKKVGGSVQENYPKIQLNK